MRKFSVLALTFFSFSAFAEVIDLKNIPVQSVLSVYEEEEMPSQDQSWIHGFEKDPLGKEMDHLVKFKRNKAESRE